MLLLRKSKLTLRYVLPDFKSCFDSLRVSSQLSDTNGIAAQRDCRSRRSLSEQNNNKNNSSSSQPPNIAPVSGVLNLSVNIFDIITSITIVLLSSKEFHHLLKTLQILFQQLWRIVSLQAKYRLLGWTKTIYHRTHMVFHPLNNITI